MSWALPIFYRLSLVTFAMFGLSFFVYLSTVAGTHVTDSVIVQSLPTLIPTFCMFVCSSTVSGTIPCW